METIPVWDYKDLENHVTELDFAEEIAGMKVNP